MSVFYSAAELLQRARAGDGAAAAELWRLIDKGDVPPDVALTWVRDVAHQVVAKVLDPDAPANRRSERARAALGLEGRALDVDLDLHRLVADNPGLSAADLAKSADLVLERVNGPPVKVKRQIDYLRKKSK